MKLPPGVSEGGPEFNGNLGIVVDDSRGHGREAAEAVELQHRTIQGGGALQGPVPIGPANRISKRCAAGRIVKTVPMD